MATSKTEVIIERAGQPAMITGLDPAELRVVEHSPEGLQDLGKMQFRPVGKCIYCGATGALSREHIVPFALGGTAVLPEASCAACARLTSQVELQVLRGPMRAVRMLRRLPSRRGHADAPTDVPLTVVRGGVTESIRLPVAEYPILLHFPTYLPVDLSLRAKPVGIEMRGISTLLFGPSPEVVMKRLGAQSITVRTGGDRPVAFARMLAKVAWAFAISQGADRMLKGPALVTPSILGQSNDVGRWVGAEPGPHKRYAGLLHRLELIEDRQHGLLVVEVQLFSDSDAPSYRVILGLLR